VIYGTFALLTLIWGTTWAAIRVGLDGVPPFTGVALRFAVASLVLFALGWKLGIPFGRAPNEKRAWIAVGLLSFCVSYGVVYWSEQWVPSGVSSVIFSTFPLLVAVLAHFFLPGERLRLGSAAGILLGFAGIGIIYSEDFSRLGGREVRMAAVVLLLSPVASAMGYTLAKKWGAGVHPISLSAVPMAITAVVMGGVAWATERGQVIRFTPQNVGALLYLALLGSAVTFTLYYWLLSILPATRLSLIAYTIPVVAVFVGSVFLHEPMTLRIAAGSLLVIGGVAVAAKNKS